MANSSSWQLSYYLTVVWQKKTQRRTQRHPHSLHWKHAHQAFFKSFFKRRPNPQAGVTFAIKGKNTLNRSPDPPFFIWPSPLARILFLIANRMNSHQVHKFLGWGEYTSIKAVTRSSAVLMSYVFYFGLLGFSRR